MSGAAYMDERLGPPVVTIAGAASAMPIRKAWEITDGPDVADDPVAKVSRFDYGAMLRRGTIPIQLPVVSVGDLPSASPAGRLLFVPNASGGAVVCFSDGTDWRCVTDRTVVQPTEHAGAGEASEVSTATGVAEIVPP